MANNIKTLQNALKWLERRIREEVKLDGCTSVDHAAELEFIERMLKKFPLRNCDMGTAEEQKIRMADFCKDRKCVDCVFRDTLDCRFDWGQLPYDERKMAK